MIQLFRWKVPNEPPDFEALARMRLHFPKPSEPMPYAWFMGDIDFMMEIMDAPPEMLDSQMILRPLSELASGIVIFHMVSQYIPVWKSWYRYLLPYALSIEDIPTVDGLLLGNLLKGCFALYPQKIAEEYPGFRNDLVYTLGMLVVPLPIARDNMRLKDKLKNPLFNDIWYTVD